MITVQRKKELYYSWCLRNDCRGVEKKEWKYLYDSLEREEQEYIDHINALHRSWGGFDTQTYEEDEKWYESLSLEDRLLITIWDKEHCEWVIEGMMRELGW